MKNLETLSKDYERIEKAIQFLGENFQDQPSLAEIAHAAGMSEFHFQKMFQRWAGISPKRFLQFLTKEHAKELLKNSNLMDASFDTGLSGPSRLHDLFISCEAVSPGEFKQKGKGLVIKYGFHPSPFGKCFIALTDRGICSLLFPGKMNQKEILKEFKKTWANAEFLHDQNETRKFVEVIFNPAKSKTGTKPIRLLCRGTNFQIKVWEALLRIPKGSVVTYQTIAQAIGSPRASRAVGSAVSKNSIAYLIPCHRVIRGLGHLGGYRWGLPRKQAILGLESGA